MNTEFHEKTLAVIDISKALAVEGLMVESELIWLGAPTMARAMTISGEASPVFVFSACCAELHMLIVTQNSRF